MTQVAGLNFKSPEEVAPLKSTVVLYGPAGSGKSTFASTWPGVYVLAPGISSNELKSYQGQGLKDNVLVFDTMTEMNQQMTGVAKLVRDGQLPKCRTLVFDNLTSAQLVAEHELLDASSGGELGWKGWGKFAGLWKEAVLFLHNLPINIVWITHSKTVEITPDAHGAAPYTQGGPSLIGKSKDFIPGYADMFLYCDTLDRGTGIPREFRVHLKSKDVWPARVRGDIERVRKLPDFLGGLTDNNQAIRPTYDQLAKMLGWKSKAEIEGEEPVKGAAVAQVKVKRIVRRK